MKFYTVSRLGPKQSMTPEGFLLCEEVPIARTGQMLYGPDEVPVEPGPDGIVRIERDADDVFAPKTIASANCKSVVDDHPEEDVGPHNWRDLTVGILQNPRRGEGAASDLLLADLLITDHEAIEAVKAGKREVSMGYDADYEQVKPGYGRQHSIIYNHVALVEEGRCGPRCAIGDKSMTKKPRRTAWDRLMTAWKAKDEEAFKEAMEQAKDEAGVDDPDEGGDTHVHVHLNGGAPAGELSGGAGDKGKDSKDAKDEAGEEQPAWFKTHVESNNARFDKLEKALGELKGGAKDAEAEAEGTDPDEEMETADAELGAAPGDMDEGDVETGKGGKTGDAARSTKDSSTLKTAFQDALARAEILSPGIKLPTYDAKAPYRKTADALCGFRKLALTKAMADEEMAEVVKEANGGLKPPLKSMTCDAARILFLGASSLAKRANHPGVGVHDSIHAQQTSLAARNQANRDFWSKRS